MHDNQNNTANATALIRRGFRVFRLRPNHKGGKGGFLDNDWTAEATGGLLEACERWAATPAANIGILTTDLCAIDVDTKAGKAGLASLEALKAEGNWPDTYTQRTPSGGLHFVFRAAGLGIRNSTEALAPGIDVRGHNGYIVGAGSQIDGRAYTVACDAPVADLPEWLHAKITATQERPEAIVAATGEIDTPRLVEYVRGMLLDAAPAIQGEGGDNRTIALANDVMDCGLSPGATVEAMADCWNDRCAPPWELSELERKVNSAASSRDNAIGCRNPFAGFAAVPVEALPPRENWFEPRVPEWDLTAEKVEQFPARPWIIPGLLMRGVITQIVAPGATGKTALQMQVAAAVSLGAMHTIATTSADGSQSYRLREAAKVLLINFEDSQEELDRRAGAAFKYFGLDYSAARGRMRVFSGSDHNFKLLVRDGKGRLVETPQVADLIDYIKRHGFGVVMLDPLADMHEADENSNSEMRRVADVLRKIATATRAAVLIAHHTRKPPSASADSFAGNMDAGRGASAIVGAVRISLTMFHMTDKDAKAMGITEVERHKYVRLDDAKMNLVLSSPFARWFKKETVTVGVEREGLGAFVPVTLAPHKTDPAPHIAAALLAGLIDNGGSMSLTGAAVELARDPFYGDASDTARRRAIKQALEARPAEAGGYIIAFEAHGATGGVVTATRKN